MSRIGKHPVEIPEGVEIKLEGNKVIAKGPLGTEEVEVAPELDVKVEDKTIVVTRKVDDRKSRSLHGLFRTLVNNAVVGVKQGFTKNLEINGVGYRVALQGKSLNLTLGYSHPVIVDPIDGISFEVPNSNTVVVNGADKQKVGEVAAQIRGKRPPEPYLGKGIKYAGEKIRRKSGKAGKS